MPIPKRLLQHVSVLACLWVALALGACGSTERIRLFVSPDGSDDGDGTMAQPFATLPAAVAATRALRSEGATGPITIYLREGRHQLDETLVLGIEDGAPAPSSPRPVRDAPGAGTVAPAHLTFAAFPGESPVISAGIPISGWSEVGPETELPYAARGHVWVTDMPEGMNRFYTLYDSQGRLNRSQEEGFLPTQAGDLYTLHFPDGYLSASENTGDIEILVRPSFPWTINMLPLESVDAAAGVATTAVAATYDISPLVGRGLFFTDPGASVWVENTLRGLDSPGEWAVNTLTRRIYVWPRDPADDGAPRGILVPSTSELVRVEGEVDYDGPSDVPVRGIAFESLTFSHGDRWAWRSDDERLGWGYNTIGRCSTARPRCCVFARQKIARCTDRRLRTRGGRA